MILLRDATKYIAVGEEDITLTDLQELVNSIAVTPNVEMSLLDREVRKVFELHYPADLPIAVAFAAQVKKLKAHDQHKHLTGETPNGHTDSPRERSHLVFDVFAVRTGSSLNAGAGGGIIGAEGAI